MAMRVDERKRVTEAGAWSSDASYGCNGVFEMRLKSGRKAMAVVSDGGGWEHVSVSLPGWNKCPSWEEMCEVKALFWEPEDCVVQYHPPESEYVNHHAYCLHLWRPSGGEGLPRPPSAFVGARLSRPHSGRDGEGEGEERETATGQLVLDLMELALDNGLDEDERSFVDPARRYCELRNEAVRLGFFKGKPVPLETGDLGDVARRRGGAEVGREEDWRLAGCDLRGVREE